MRNTAPRSRCRPTIRRAVRRTGNRPASVRTDAKLDPRRRIGEGLVCALRPLDERNAVTVEQIVETELDELLLSGDAIEVYVVKRDGSRVLADDRIGRTRDRLRDPESERDALRNRRFSRSERPVEEKERSGVQARPDSSSERQRLVFRAGDDGQGSSPFVSSLLMCSFNTLSAGRSG